MKTLRAGMPLVTAKCCPVVTLDVGASFRMVDRMTLRTNPKVNFRFEKPGAWQQEIKELRRIVLELPVTEELKWGQPFYTFNKGNVLVIWAFKDYCALGFCKGALLKDVNGILSKIGENTQAGRKIQFRSLPEITRSEEILKAYIREAIEIEKAGLEVEYKKTSEFVMPDELTRKLGEDTKFKAAFDALTPGRQRGYILHFSAPKQSKTREARIEKYRPLILKGEGLRDEYQRSRKQ